MCNYKTGISNGNGIREIPVGQEIPETRETPESQEYPKNSCMIMPGREKFETTWAGEDGNFPLNIPDAPDLQKAPATHHLLGGRGCAKRVLGGPVVYHHVTREAKCVADDMAWCKRLSLLYSTMMTSPLQLSGSAMW